MVAAVRAEEGKIGGDNRGFLQTSPEDRKD
jgi:hypothetical protein